MFRFFAECKIGNTDAKSAKFCKKKFAPTGFFLALDYFGPFGNLKSVPPENIGKITIAIFWRGANMP